MANSSPKVSYACLLLWSLLVSFESLFCSLYLNLCIRWCQVPTSSNKGKEMYATEF